MRVLISAESFEPSINGVTNSVVRMVRHLRTRGHEVEVVAPAPGPDRTVDDVPVTRVPGATIPFYGSMTFGLASSRAVDEVIERFRPDAVHLAAPVVLGARIGERAAARGVPTVAVFQTDISGFVRQYGLSAMSGPVWTWLRRVHRNADLTLAPTETVADELERRGFGEVAVWGRGVDHLQFDRRRRIRRPGEDRVRVGYVGRLAREKQLDDLAPVLALPGVDLVIVGDGPERDQLTERLPGATFTGFLRGDALGEAVASLDVFVHPGTHETFCQAIQEAMAAGVPVVAPAAGGPLDLVVPEETGLLYPPGRPSELVAAVARLAGDAALRARFGEAGRAKVAGRTWGAIGDELIAHYEAAIASRSLSAMASSSSAFGEVSALRKSRLAIDASGTT